MACIVSMAGMLLCGIAEQIAIAQQAENPPYLDTSLPAVSGHFHIDGQIALPE